MDSTSRLALNKPNPDPTTGDFVDVSKLNDNFDKIDAAISSTLCTSATRPTSPFTGQMIFETDTKIIRIWNGSAWQFVKNTQNIGDFVTIVKPSNETLPLSTTTMQDDDHLFLPVEANATYLMDGDIIYSATATADLQVGWSGPSGAAMEWSSWAYSAAGSGSPAYEGILKFESRNIGQTQAWGGTGAIIHAQPKGCLSTSGTAGTLKFRWAQQTSEATGNIVYAKSWIRLQRVA